MWEVWRIADTVGRVLFFDSSVASERVKSDYASILNTKLSDFQDCLSVFLEREFLLKCLEFCLAIPQANGFTILVLCFSMQTLSNSRGFERRNFTITTSKSTRHLSR